MSRTILTVAIVLSTLLLSAQGFTTIKGSIQGASGYSIRLLTWSDQVTFIEKKLASATIDEKGNFNLIVEIKAPTFAFFAIGNIRAEIILEPGRAYEVKFSDYPPAEYLETRNLILQNERLEYTLINQPSDNINQIVAEATIMYNDFLARHYMDLYLKRQGVVDAFIDTFFLRFGVYTDPWISKLVDYKIATLKLSGYKISTELAWQMWFQGRDIEYHHPDFMDLFNQLFSNYLTTRLKNYSYSELKNIINSHGTFFMLSELIGRDTVLRNEQLRELVMIKGLGEIYHNRDFYSGNVLKILHHIAAASKFREHRMIASNLIFLNTRFEKGMMAADFSLPDLEGNIHSLSKYRGKYVYLAFFASNCIPCLAEFKLLSDIYPALKSHLEVITIGLDPDFNKFKTAMEQYQYPWQSLHFNNDFELTDRYDIRNYPFFILIAPDGSFDTYGARQPSAQFKSWFEEVVLKQN